MKGILLIDKPTGFTSFDVVAKMRGISKTRRIGHSGTLDPMATGVLPLFLDRATKAAGMLPNQDKRYTAELLLGVTTDTQDSTGKELSRSPVTVGRAEVERWLRGIEGELQQLPPMFSAVQVDGRRLYDLAREGKTVERQPRTVTIYETQLLEADETAHRYTVDVRCSKGTYIRTLCHDLGEALGCGAVMTALRRTEACGYQLEDCVTLEEAQSLAAAGELELRLLPVETAFVSLPRVTLDAKQSALFCNGVRLNLEWNGIPRLDGSYTVYGETGAFLGVARNDLECGEMRLEQLFAER